jgi:tetratricopeptide (TPR) repeat protein
MNSHDLPGLIRSGVAAQRSGQADQAVQIYQRVLSQDPRNVVALANLAVLFGEKHQYERAEALLRRLIEIDPRNVDTHANLAAALHDLGRFDEAIACCERGLQLTPDHRKILNTLASSLSGAERYDDAIALLTRMTRARPRYAKGHHYLGAVYTKLGRCDDAVQAFDQATGIDPRDPESLVAAAECLLIHSRFEAALERLDKALLVSPYEVRGLALKTLALAELGRQDEERWLSDPHRFVHVLRLSDLGYGPAEVGMLNRALSAFASNESSMRQDPPEYATVKSWHTTTNLADSPDEAIVVLKRFIAYAFEQRLKSLPNEDPAHPFVRNKPQQVITDLWAVRMASGSKMLPHIHPTGWLSGVYYVDVPSIVEDAQGGQAGWLQLGSPRIDIKLTRQPITRAVRPEPGMMVTFPSYLWHDTVPLPEDNREQRLCLAYDLHPVKAAPETGGGRATHAQSPQSA